MGSDRKKILGLAAVLIALPLVARADSLSITKIEPTPLFPKAAPGEPQRQIVRLSLKNPAAATEVKVTIAVAGSSAYEESLGSLASGTTTKDVRVPEITSPTEATFTLFAANAAKPTDVKKTVLQPQRKWRDLLRLLFAPRPGLRELSAPAADRHPPRQHRAAAAILPRDRLVGRRQPLPLRCRDERADHQLSGHAQRGRRRRTRPANPRGSDSDRGDSHHGEYRADEPRTVGAAVVSDEPPHPRLVGRAGDEDRTDRRRGRADLAAGDDVPRGGRPLFLPRAQRLRRVLSAGLGRGGLLLARAGGRSEQPSARTHAPLRYQLGLDQRRRRASDRRHHPSGPAKTVAVYAH